MCGQVDAPLFAAHGIDWRHVLAGYQATYNHGLFPGHPSQIVGFESSDYVLDQLGLASDREGSAQDDQSSVFRFKARAGRKTATHFLVTVPYATQTRRSCMAVTNQANGDKQQRALSTMHSLAIKRRRRWKTTSMMFQI